MEIKKSESTDKCLGEIVLRPHLARHGPELHYLTSTIVQINLLNKNEHKMLMLKVVY